MATAVLTNVPTTISLAESTTGWTGDTFSLEPDIKVQGSNSVACAMTATGSNEIYYTGFTAADLSAVHLRLWFNITFIGNLASSNQIQVLISDGTNTAYWTIQNPGDYAGGWSQAVIYTGNTPTSGTKPTGNSTRVGMRFTTATKPRNVPANAWFDAWYYGDGYTVTGGTSGDEIDWAHIAALDKTQAYGVTSLIDGVYFLAGEITIGAGATTTYFKEEAQICVFKDLPVLSTLYQLIYEGSGCNVDLSGGVITVAGTTFKFTLDASEANLNAFTITGKQISKAFNITFQSGQTVNNSVFDGLTGQIDTGGATFENNTISNGTSSVGTLLFPADSGDVSGLSFINCDNGVEYGSTSDSTSPVFDDLTFDDVSGNYDVNNTSGASVTISLNNGSNANSYNPAGDTVTFAGTSRNFKFTVNPSITGYEWRLYTVTALGSMVGATEIDGEEDATADNQTYTYTYSANQNVALQIISQPDEDYEESITYYVLADGDQDINIILVKDNNN
jgi:hypothetical protein